MLLATGHYTGRDRSIGSTKESGRYIVEPTHPCAREATCYKSFVYHCVASRTDTYLNTPTLFASTPNLNVDESWGAVESNRVKGSRGSRIVFSWTWKENKKKDIELLSNASSSTVCITGGTSVDCF